MIGSCIYGISFHTLALAIVAKAKALYNWKGSKESHLTILKDDIISILQQGDKWWSGELNGQVGW